MCGKNAARGDSDVNYHPKIFSPQLRQSRPSVHRAGLAGIVWLCALVGSLVLGVSCASAFLTHEFLPAPSKKISVGVPTTGPHGEPVPVPGPLGDVASMTVDSGELYVAELVKSQQNRGESRIDKFDASSGAFASQLPQLPSLSYLYQGVTVGHSTGEPQLYVGGDEPETKNGVVAVLGPAGGVLGEWKGADTPSKAFGCLGCQAEASIAVDANPSNLTDWVAGDVYVTDLEHHVVDVFKPLAGGREEYVTQLTGPEPPGVTFSELVGVAVDSSSGDVVVADRQPGSVIGNVYLFRPAPITGQYELVRKLAGPPPTESFGKVNGVTVDSGNGHIYVWEGEEPRPVYVDEFDSEGMYLSRLSGTPTGASGEIHPFDGSLKNVTVDPKSHHVYIADFSGENNVSFVDVFGGDLVIPDVTTEAASSVGALSAKLNGTVNPDKEGETSCRFEWGTTRAFGQTAPCEPEKVADGSSPVGVHAVLNGVLQPDTTYYYRLQASNKNGTNPGEAFQDQQFTTSGPGLHAESVSDISSSSATLEASVNPHNAPTSYYFQYGKSLEYEAQAPLAPGAALGSGEGDVEVLRHLQGLSPSTLYHYRVVAVSELKPGELETFAAADQTFVTQAAGSALALPDARQWELVSPPDKHGAVFEPISEGSQIQAATSGGAMTYQASIPTEESVRGFVAGEVQVMSRRGGAGAWSSQDITLPHATATGLATGGGGPEYRFFSPDLSSGLIQPWGGFTSLAPESFPPDSERTPYVRHDFTCASTPVTCFEPLLTGAPGYADVPQGTKFGGAGNGFGPVVFVGSNENLTHVILATSVQLTSTFTGSKEGLYEWSADRQASERLQLVSLLPANVKGEEIPAGEATLGFRGDTRHAVSEDGSRIVWSGGDHLYVRDVVRGKTVQLDLPEAQCVSAHECGDGVASPAFQLASSDGSRVFFTDTQRLTKDSGVTGSNRRDLYECKIVERAGVLGCELSDLTPVSPLVEAADVQGAVIGSSEDASWVYFVANGVLGNGVEHGAIPGDCKMLGSVGEGVCNLYSYHNGVTSLVAVVAGEDFPDWAGNGGGSVLGGLTARVSPDGRWLAFMSSRPLTGYDNRDAFSGKPDEEVFTYHVETPGPGSLVCASCDPTGARPVGVEYKKLNDRLVGGGGVWPGETWIAANIPGWTPYRLGTALYQSRYLSDEGRVFFNSSDALVPQDINKNEDVYEYEPVGVGGCSSSSSTFSVGSSGCVGLISSGTAAGASAFMDASENGSDVFFLTGEKLVASDFDTALDLYDAHACTAVSPCPSVSVSPPACTTADACRAAPALQPSLFGAPASATFAGTGNVAQPGSGALVKPRSLSRTQKLNRALSTCRKKLKDKKVRARLRVCERQAKRRYGAKQSRKANVMKGKG
jgi:hypothetical protein